MLGELAKKAVNLVVVALAAVTFFLVPVGNKTLFGHAKALFATREADELGRALESTGRKLAEEVQSEAVPHATKKLASPDAGK